jgi:predicted Zn-dependent peptidase
MLFRGTASHPTSLALETAFEAIGGNVNAATDAETTCFYSRVHPDRVAEGLNLFASMLLTPTLSGIEIEKRIIIEEALDDINEAGDEIHPENIASRLLWPDTSLAFPTVGTIESIEKITRQDLLEHLSTWYVPVNAVVAVSGPVDHAKALAAADFAFSSWGGNTPPAIIPVDVRQQEPALSFVPNPDSQVNLQVAFRSLPRRDPRIMALRIMRRVLAGGGSSRLHLLLREELGIVYSVETGLSAFEETGSFSVDLSTAPDNLLLAVSSVLDECRRLADEAIPADELERVRQVCLFDLEFSRDSAYEVANRVAWGEAVGLPRTLEEERKEIERVTAADIQATARSLFTAANLNMVLVGPVGDELKNRIEAQTRGFGTATR